MNSFRYAVIALAVSVIASSSTSTILAVPTPTDRNAVSPFDKPDREQLTPIEKAQLPDITVGVVTVDSGSVLSAIAPDGKHAAFSNNTAKTVILRLPIKNEAKKDGPKK